MRIIQFPVAATLSAVDVSELMQEVYWLPSQFGSWKRIKVETNRADHDRCRVLLACSYAAFVFTAEILRDTAAMRVSVQLHRSVVITFWIMSFLPVLATGWLFATSPAVDESLHRGLLIVWGVCGLVGLHMAVEMRRYSRHILATAREAFGESPFGKSPFGKSPFGDSA